MFNYLINILEETYTPAEIIEMLNSIDKIDIENYALDNYICPICCGELIVHKYKERRPDYWGSPAYEEMCDLVCERCGEVF